MAPLILHHKEAEPMLSVPYWFLTEYMPEANGDFVKVYLYLLFTATRSDASLSIATLADELSCTESDVVRALRYWAKKGLLSLQMDQDNLPCEIAFLDAASPSSVIADMPMQTGEIPASKADSDLPDEQHAVRSDEGRQDSSLGESSPVLLYSSDPVFSQLILIAEKYLSRTLTPYDVDMFASWYHDSNRNADLIDYLMQYCIEIDKTSLSYMNKVLNNWLKEGITTPGQAKESCRNRTRDAKAYLRTIGANHDITQEEWDKLDYWKKNLGFSIELILEAAARMIRETGKESFPYMDAILKGWMEKGVQTMEDVAKADEEHRNARVQDHTGSRSPSAKPSAARPSRGAAPNRFHNFDQRAYDKEWDKELLAPYQKSAGTEITDEDWEKMMAPLRGSRTSR